MRPAPTRDSAGIPELLDAHPSAEPVHLGVAGVVGVVLARWFGVRPPLGRW